MLLGIDPGLPLANAGEIAPKVPGIDKATARKRLEIGRTLDQCARCHDKIDPLPVPRVRRPMPLLDHFRKPADTRAPWASVGTFWVTALAKSINAALPRDRYLALATVHLGDRAEADIAEFELGDGLPFEEHNGHGGTATLLAPAAVATFEATFPEEFEVQIKDLRDDMRLVGAIEFVSPANKDRASERAKFVSKCLAYLGGGIGLVLVDVVTTRPANLHNELMAALDAPPTAVLPDGPTYVASYRPTRPHERTRIDTWPYPCEVGTPIPGVPLALKDGPTIRLDLEGTYMDVLAGHNL